MGEEGRGEEITATSKPQSDKTPSKGAQEALTRARVLVHISLPIPPSLLPHTLRTSLPPSIPPSIPTSLLTPLPPLNYPQLPLLSPPSQSQSPPHTEPVPPNHNHPLTPSLSLAYLRESARASLRRRRSRGVFAHQTSGSRRRLACSPVM